MAYFEIKNCPMCGATAEEDATNVNDIYGIGWQSMSIECTMCDMNLVLTAELECMEKTHESLINCWNNLSHKYPGKKFKIELSKEEIKNLIVPALNIYKEKLYDEYKNNEQINRHLACKAHFIEEILNHMNKKIMRG